MIIKQRNLVIHDTTSIVLNVELVADFMCNSTSYEITFINIVSRSHIPNGLYVYNPTP